MDLIGSGNAHFEGSCDGSGSSSPKNGKDTENGNLLYLLKNCLIISKDSCKSQPNDVISYYGLENKSNNCYCNAVLQSLFSYYEFRKRIVKYKNHSNGIATEVAKLYNKIITHKDIQSPMSLLKKIYHNNDDFVLGDQQDAHEFLTYIINTLMDEIKEADGIKRGRTWLNELVEGYVKSQTKCHECGNITGILEPFITLSLDIYENCDINYCMERYCDVELLTGKDQFFCDLCNKYCDASKSVKFDLMPPLLVLHLKRFNYSDKKNKYEAFERLPYLVKSCSEISVNCVRHPQPIIYELISVISHIGTSPHYGHYINISELNGLWYKCDDASVLKLNDHHHVIGDELSQGNDGSYILFYRIKE